LRRTLAKRPDMLEQAALSADDKKTIEKIIKEGR